MRGFRENNFYQLEVFNYTYAPINEAQQKLAYT